MACIDCGPKDLPWTHHEYHNCPLLPGQLRQAEREAEEAIEKRDIYRYQMSRREAERS